jgi:GTP cyclohydrolase I
MRDTSDEEFKNMAKQHVLKQLQALGEDKGEENLDTMKERLRIMEWHDLCHALA